MPKKPFLKVFVNDWRVDTENLTAATRGAWADWMFEMSKQPVSGLISGLISQHAKWVRDTEANTMIYLMELKTKGVGKVEFLDNGMIQVSSGRMMRDAKRSQKQSEGGITAMEKRYGKNYAKPITELISIDTAYNNYNSNSNNEISNNTEGVTGGTTRSEMIEANLVPPYYNEFISGMPMTIQECHDMYRHPSNEMVVAQLCQNVQMLPPKLYRWLAVFCADVVAGGETMKTYEDFRSHFKNWMNIQARQGNLNKEPEKLFEYNERGTNAGDSRTRPPANTGARPASASIIRRNG
jgi:hypothetical protein